MRYGGAKRKRDTAEPAIIAALRAVGAEVWQVNGAGLPDLLVRSRGRLVGLEVKTGTAKRTKAQVVTNWPIVRTVDEALSASGLTTSPRRHR